MKQQFFLERDNDVPLVVTGELVGEGTTKKAGLSRWQTCKIYKTDQGYAAHILGETRLEGESTRYWAKTAPTPQNLMEGIKVRFGEVHRAVQRACIMAGIWKMCAVTEGHEPLEDKLNRIEVVDDQIFIPAQTVPTSQIYDFLECFIGTLQTKGLDVCELPTSVKEVN